MGEWAWARRNSRVEWGVCGVWTCILRVHSRAIDASASRRVSSRLDLRVSRRVPSLRPRVVFFSSARAILTRRRRRNGGRMPSPPPSALCERRGQVSVGSAAREPLLPLSVLSRGLRPAPGTVASSRSSSSPRRLRALDANNVELVGYTARGGRSGGERAHSVPRQDSRRDAPGLRARGQGRGRGRAYYY